MQAGAVETHTGQPPAVAGHGGSCCVWPVAIQWLPDCPNVVRILEPLSMAPVSPMYLSPVRAVMLVVRRWVPALMQKVVPAGCVATAFWMLLVPGYTATPTQLGVS